jgi:hypothetical protein
LAYYLTPSWFGIGGPKLPGTFDLSTVLGTNFLVSALLVHVVSAVIFSLTMIGLLFLMRILLRNQKAAVAASILIAALSDSGSDYWAFALCLLFFYPIVFFALTRFGIVSVAFFVFFWRLFMDLPVRVVFQHRLCHPGHTGSHRSLCLPHLPRRPPAYIGTQPSPLFSPN